MAKVVTKDSIEEYVENNYNSLYSEITFDLSEEIPSDNIFVFNEELMMLSDIPSDEEIIDNEVQLDTLDDLLEYLEEISYEY